jgi:transposase
MRKYARLLADKQWSKIEPLLPEAREKRKRGRPPAENRDVLEGILWILKTGARWKDVPAPLPSGSTCRRRLLLWEEEGLWLEIWRLFLADLDEKQILDWDEAFIDGSFAPAKKGALESEKPRGAKERSGWWWSTVRVFRLEAISTLPRPQKSHLSRRPSNRSKSDEEAAQKHDPKG